MSAESFGGFATLVKLYGFKAALGMIGAAMLYIVLPPLNTDGTFNKGEFVARLACAGVFSCLLGGTAYQLLCAQLPTIGAMVNASAIDLIVGAPGWWISRAVALWFQRRNDKDIAEMARDVKESL
ncbi:hypothetical protein [Janthinobacterium fluminis]|uniref:Holin n=1 Tax=Janthinobacterium fluminis TaxID=2987524 RepID=A0ABT5JZC8_9BURK|nr:hypothetical protein [Janthinobacterium fluminis]MDC8757513.1 hypothetical protein [Janthinobacterium fluminis]